ncbi:MAG: acetylgalactosaminidase, partial [Chitinophagaceae bacterium]
MSSNRRQFIRNLTLGSGALATGITATAKDFTELENPANHAALFNMCGYAAPKMDKVRIGIIGLGMRGPGAVERMCFIEGAEIVALCDKVPDRVESAQAILAKAGLPKAKAYTGNDGWKALCES